MRPLHYGIRFGEGGEAGGEGEGGETGGGDGEGIQTEVYIYIRLQDSLECVTMAM